MTIFGWDASHYDAPPTRRDGVDWYTHKCAEGHHFYKDAEYQAAMNAARNLGVPVLGAYFVNHPGTVADQADWWVSIVERETPWWRQVPFIWQIDAERFKYMSRAPTLAEINALGDAVCQRAKVPASSVIAYAPKWLYGDTLKGLKFRLWASSYGTNPAVPYRDAYPGDTSSRWGAYSGQTPIILQYGSRTTIAGQTTCDANAFRGTLDQLRALLNPAQREVIPLDTTMAEGLAWRMDALTVGADSVRGGPTKGEPVWIVRATKAVAAAVGQVDEQVAAKLAADFKEIDVAVAAARTEIGRVDEDVWAKLGSAEVTTQQKADMLRQWLGAEASAVGALLAG